MISRRALALLLFWFSLSNKGALQRRGAGQLLWMQAQMPQGVRNSQLTAFSEEQGLELWRRPLRDCAAQPESAF